METRQNKNVGKAAVTRLRKNLEKAKANDRKYNHMRQVLLDGLTLDPKTVNGESQHDKLEIVEKVIHENLEVLHDIEAILASKRRLYE
jgi:hypothetical protein